MSSSTPPQVESMTFSQAVVSARMYDSNYPEYTDWNGLVNNMKDIPNWAKFILSTSYEFQSIVDDIKTFCPTRPKWPDLHGHYPFHLEKGSSQEDYGPYFRDVKNAVKEGKMFNFYNPFDYPTGQYNTESGLMNRVSGAYLIDQLIKPYRLISWPLYSDRAFRVVYGASNLTDEQKVYFKYDSTRKDRFCISAWPIHTCGIALTCGGEEIYDFKVNLDRYRMIAYGCSSYSRTLGGHDENQNIDPSSGFIEASRDINLSDEPYKYGKYVMWHGAQFRGDLTMQRDYWVKYLTKIGQQSK